MRMGTSVSTENLPWTYSLTQSVTCNTISPVQNMQKRRSILLSSNCWHCQVFLSTVKRWCFTLPIGTNLWKDKTGHQVKGLWQRSNADTADRMGRWWGGWGSCHCHYSSMFHSATVEIVEQDFYYSHIKLSWCSRLHFKPLHLSTVKSRPGRRRKRHVKVKAAGHFKKSWDKMQILDYTFGRLHPNLWQWHPAGK